MRKLLTTMIATVMVAGIAAGNEPAYAAASEWKVAQMRDLPNLTVESITVAPTGSAWSIGTKIVDGKYESVLQHLTSKGWVGVALPASVQGWLSAVDASSSKNVWMFGVTSPSNSPHRPKYAARWNGTRWTKTPLPSDFQVSDAAALSANDVWAADRQQYRGYYLEHWNGKSWKKVAVPFRVHGITALSSKDIWAAGNNKGQPGVMHWNGSKWSVAKTPKVKLPPNNETAGAPLRDIAVVSSKNIWAVGEMAWECGNDDYHCQRPLSMHWDGSKWSAVLEPEAPNTYTKVVPDGSGGVWALQGSYDPSLVHIVGTKVTRESPPSAGDNGIGLGALAAHGKTVWAGGDTTFGTSGEPDYSPYGVYLRTG
jgi:hypothetical protein